MSDLRSALASLELDESGRVVLGDGTLGALVDAHDVVVAGGANQACINNQCLGGVNRGGCINTGCIGGHNEGCENHLV